MLEKKVKKIREIIRTGNHGANIARYIPGVLKFVLQSMLEDIDTKEKPERVSCKDMEQLELLLYYFEISLPHNYYINPSSTYTCFPMKIKKSTDVATRIDDDLITFNNIFAHLVKEISITKYESDIELIPAFLRYQVYQHSDSMLKHLPKDALAKIENTILYSEKPVYYSKTSLN